MLKRFDLYLIKEIIPPFIVGILLFSFVLLMNEVLLLSDLLISKGVPFKAAVKIFTYLLPSILVFTFPMAILAGVLGGLSRMSSDSEVVAFKTLGIGFKRLLKPVFLLSFLGCFFTFFLTLYLAPRFNHKCVRTLSTSVLSKVQLRINPREFNELIPETMIFIQDVTLSGRWKNIFVHSTQNPSEERVILAREGNLRFYPEEKRATIELKRGELHSYPPGEPEKYSFTEFEEFEQEIEVERLFAGFSVKKRVREKDIGELLAGLREIKGEMERIEEEKAELMKSRDKAQSSRLKEFETAMASMRRARVYHLVEIHKRFAFPLAAVIFGFLALPLGISTRKGGRMSGFTISLGVIIIYYVFITGGEALAKDGKIPPFIGVWGGNFILFLVAFYSFLQMMREAPLFPWMKGVLRKKPEPTARVRKKKLSSSQVRFTINFPGVLDRYLIKKFAAIFFIVFVAVTLVFAVVTFLERVDDITEQNTPLILVFEEIFYDLPAFIHANILPTSILAATLLTLGLLTKSNEITAIKACGISVYRLIIPLVLIGILASLFSFYLQENVLPHTNRRREEAWNRMHNLPARSYAYLDRRWVLSRSKERIFHYHYFDRERGIFSNLTVYDINPQIWSLKRNLHSEKAYLSDPILRLENCWFRDFSEGIPITYQKKERMEIEVDEGRDYFFKELKEPDQMNFKELRGYIRDIEESGFETRKFRVDLYFKTSFPFVSLIITIFAIPFAFSMGKKGTLVGIGLTIVIAMVYWGVIGISRSLGYTGFLPPLLAAWGPNIIFGLVGVYFLFSVKT